jgi:hypothetical protein
MSVIGLLGICACTKAPLRADAAANAKTSALHHVGVNLRGLHVGMAEQLLHYAQIRTAIQEMRCEGVTQRVRMEGGG